MGGIRTRRLALTFAFSLYFLLVVVHASATLTCTSIIYPGKTAGEEIYSAFGRVAKQEDCESLCCADPKCKAWTYSLYDGTYYYGCQGVGPCCFLRNYYTFNIDESQMVSGVKKICNPGCIHGKCTANNPCECTAGWTGADCATDINECIEQRDICGPHTICHNVPGSYACSCREGFKNENGVCKDINECATGVAKCKPYSTCLNIFGSYACSCNIGFHGDGLTTGCNIN